MNYVLWLMYAADIVGSVGAACVVLIFVFACWFGIVAALEVFEDQMVSWSTVRLPVILLVVASSVGIFTPGKSTIYAIAATYIGEQVVATEEFELLRKILKKELRKLAE